MECAVFHKHSTSGRDENNCVCEERNSQRETGLPVFTNLGRLLSPEYKTRNAPQGLPAWRAAALQRCTRAEALRLPYRSYKESMFSDLVLGTLLRNPEFCIIVRYFDGRSGALPHLDPCASVWVSHQVVGPLSSINPTADYNWLFVTTPYTRSTEWSCSISRCRISPDATCQDF